MTHKNTVFIARSLDGYIAGRNGELDWLDMIPNHDNDDMGYFQLMSEIDAIVMGRVSFETVLGFDIEWPYEKHVFVLSKTLETIPENLTERVTILQGGPKNILSQIHERGYYKLYIDGGKTIQNFLKEDLIDELRITTIPVLLGGGYPLFGELTESLEFKHTASKLFLGQLVQNHYRRKRV